MSSSSEEILESRGLKEIIKFQGFTPHGYRDRSHDVLKSADIWDLEVKVIPKNKKFLEFIMYDYKKDYVPALSGANDNHTIGLRKEQRYLDSEVLYLPFRLTGKRYHTIPETELDLLRDESTKEEGVLWEGAIPGLAPTHELM